MATIDRTVPHQGHLRLLDLTDIPPAEGVTHLIDHALELGASDVFFIANEQHIAVQVRLHGTMELISILPIDQGRRYMSHLRAEAGMDVSEHRRPQDGRMLYQHGEEITGSAGVDLRINVLPTLHGEDMGIRLLVRDNDRLSLDQLGLLPQQLADYRGMLDRSGGLLLLTGPTGSGKTVTLYSSLAYLHDGRRKIHTIEDPIEYAVEGLRQSQVNLAIELGAAELLRGIMRQAPDVIMLGEIRDLKTADTATWAASSGVRVLATIHAPTAAGSIQSLRGLGVSPSFISTSLRGAVSQRLLRTLCPACRRIDPESNRAREALKEVEPHLEDGEGAEIYAAVGCEECHQIGYTGRTGVFEVMGITEPMRDMIARGDPARQIRARAIENGMITLRQAALLKVAAGITSMEELARCMAESPLNADEDRASEDRRE